MLLDLILASDFRGGWSLQSSFSNHGDRRRRGFYLSLSTAFNFDVVYMAFIDFSFQIALPNWNVSNIYIFIWVEVWDFNQFKRLFL